MGLAWVWPAKGRFSCYIFLSSPLHHITAGCSRVKKQTKVGSSWEDKRFSERGIFRERLTMCKQKARARFFGGPFGLAVCRTSLPDSPLNDIHV